MSDRPCPTIVTLIKEFNSQIPPHRKYSINASSDKCLILVSTAWSDTSSKKSSQLANDKLNVYIPSSEESSLSLSSAAATGAASAKSKGNFT